MNIKRFLVFFIVYSAILLPIAHNSVNAKVDKTCGYYFGETVHKGCVAHYREGLMEKVARNRKMPIVDCMIASPVIKLGTWVKIQFLNTGDIKSCRVTDVAAPKDKANIMNRGIVAEVDFNTAKSQCGVKKAGDSPPWECQAIIYLDDYTIYDKPIIETDDVIIIRRNELIEWL